MNWFSQLRLSFSWDGKSGSQGEKAQECERTGASAIDGMTTVHRSLAAHKPAEAVPGSLHQSIMSAVRRSAATETVEVLRPSLNWRPIAVAASLTVVCLLGGVYFMGHRPAPKNPAVNLQQQIAALPATVISPLSKELESLQLDLEKTTSFLLASVPQMDN
jgi:hypothetical protein